MLTGSLTTKPQAHPTKFYESSNKEDTDVSVVLNEQKMLINTEKYNPQAIKCFHPSRMCFWFILFFFGFDNYRKVYAN